MAEEDIEGTTAWKKPINSSQEQKSNCKCRLSSWPRQELRTGYRVGRRRVRWARDSQATLLMEAFEASQETRGTLGSEETCDKEVSRRGECCSLDLKSRRRFGSIIDDAPQDPTAHLTLRKQAQSIRATPCNA